MPTITGDASDTSGLGASGSGLADLGLCGAGCFFFAMNSTPQGNEGTNALAGGQIFAIRRYSATYARLCHPQAAINRPELFNHSKPFRNPMRKLRTPRQNAARSGSAAGEGIDLVLAPDRGWLWPVRLNLDSGRLKIGKMSYNKISSCPINPRGHGPDNEPSSRRHQAIPIPRLLTNNCLEFDMPTPRPEASGKEDMKYADEAQATGDWCPLDRRAVCGCFFAGFGRKNDVVVFGTLAGSRTSVRESGQHMPSSQQLPETL